MYRFNKRLTLSHSQPVSSLSWHVVLHFLHPHDYKLTYECSCSFLRASHLIYRFQFEHLPVHIQFRLITASKVHLQPHPITSSKCIFQLVCSRAPSLSSNLLVYRLRVNLLCLHNLQARMIRAYKCIISAEIVTCSKCITTLGRSRPVSGSCNLLDHGR